MGTAVTASGAGPPELGWARAEMLVSAQIATSSAAEESTLRGQLDQHIGYVLELGLAVHIGGEEAVVNPPELVGFGVDVHAIDQADAGSRALACLENVVHHSGEGLNSLFRVIRIDVPDSLAIEN